MGTGVLFSALNPSFLDKSLYAQFPLLTKGPLAVNQASAAETNPATTDQLTSDPTQDIAQQFEGSVYSSKLQRLSASLTYQELAAQAAQSSDDGSSSGASVSAKQLTFNFFAESRSEDLVRFNTRTGNVADGLSGDQQSSYIEASRQVSQRFSMSLSISGAALNAFSGTSEQLQEAGDAGGIDQLLKLTNDALAQSNDTLNKIFDLLGDFFSNTKDDVQTRFQKLYEGLSNLGLVGATSGAGKALPTNGTTQIKASSINIQLQFSFESTEVTQVQQSDPIVLDLDNDGVELSHHTNGAKFDIRGNGQTASTAFVNGGDAFLAIDRNGNGQIDNGRELFGDQNGAKNGFEELRKFDSNGDSVIDASDKDFNKLMVFRDNGNGKTDSGELVSLAQAGVSQIDLRYANVAENASGGNKLAQRASFTYNDGRRGAAADALLNFTV